MPGDPFLYGLPVYTTPWMPDTLIVMGNRVGKTLAQRGWEHAQEMADRQNLNLKGMSDKDLWGQISGQLEAGRRPLEVATFGDKDRSWLMPDGTISDSSNVETVFRVGADGRPEAVTRLVDKPSPNSVRNVGESEMAWLKRRVDEICLWRLR